MQKNRHWLEIILILTVATLTLNGCAAIKKKDTENMENLLVAAGFRMHPADTPEKLAHLQLLPQHQVVVHQKNGEVYYIYADAEYTNALYLGDAQAYQQYQKLLLQKNIAEMQVNAAEDMDDMGAWEVWGPIW